MHSKQSFNKFIRETLEARKKDHRFRRLQDISPGKSSLHIQKNGRELINFCSNDYLGLANHQDIISTTREYTRWHGTGAGASRLVSGNYAIHEELEQELAEALNTEAVLLFNSGFQANVSILPALCTRHSLILADKKVHNSLLQGAMLSRAKFRRYHHNDYTHLKEQLEKAASGDYDQVWIVTETVFSMDGDRSDLDQILALSEEYGALVYSDDAHAIGVMGESGLGLNYGKKGIELFLGTFGKAFGSFGAFAGCSRNLREYLINYCPGFIYTTALPPPVIGSLSEALHLIPKMDEDRKRLMKYVEEVRKSLNELGYDTGHSDSQIIPVIIGEEEETLKLSRFLEKHGIWASAIRPPTVEENASRIRITLSAAHKPEDIQQLISVFKQWK